MAYTRLHWVESETPLSADNMNNIEDGIEELQSQKVDKVSGKALSDNNYTSAEKTKLAGIEAGAEVNVQPDWDQTDTTADDYINNKPGNASSSTAGFMSASDKSKLDGVQAGAQVNRTYTAVTGKPTAAASPAFGGTVTVSQVAQDANGQVSVTDRVITIPSSDASTSAHGLMSAADKTKLNGIAAGAQVNRTYTAVTGKPTADLHPGFGTTIVVSQVAQNANGQISVTDRPIEFPDQVATTSERGLMTPADVTKLNGIAAEATKNTISKESISLGSSKTIRANSSTSLYFTGNFPTLCALAAIEFTNSNGQTVKDIAVCGFHVGTSGSQTIATVEVYNLSSSDITLHPTYTRVRLICFS